MAAKIVLGPLWIGIVLAAIGLGTAAAQTMPSSSAEQNPASVDSSSSSQDAPAQDASVVTTTNDTPDTRIKKVGTPFPLGMDPGGYRLGPLHLISVSSSGFYNVATPQSGGAQTFVGSSFATSMVYTHPLNNGMLAVQANPTLYVSGASPYVNAIGGVSLTKQLTQRWSMDASAQWTFFQNEYLLQTPQYLLAYAAGGLTLQTLYAQRNGSTMYETNSFSMNYNISGRTQLSLSPSVNTSYNDVDGVSNLLTQFGGGATLSHSLTPNRSVSLYATVIHAFITQDQASPLSNWTTYSMGAGFSQKIGQNLYFAASAGASQQSGANQSWLPTGNVSLMKAFHRGTISAAYSRSTAAATLLSSGYFDQADIAIVRQFGTKISSNLNIGAFRSINTGSRNHGKRATASVSYGWRRNLAWLFSYSYTDQSSTQSTVYSGQTSYFTAGLTWTLGHPGSR